MLGPVQVVPPWTEPGAPAEHGSYREARTGKISQIEVSTLLGEPRNDPWSVGAVEADTAETILGA